PKAISHHVGAMTALPPRSTGVPQRPYKMFVSKREEVTKMLRKMFSLGALVVVAVTFGVGNAAAQPKKPGSPAVNTSHGMWTQGFSDGRD
ncbi:MAG: hypothetical protein WCF27_12680, partial [Gaiellaceae bacterium]